MFKTTPNFNGQNLVPISFLHRTMAAVYKALSNAPARKDSSKENATKEFRQRILMLTSRGVTFRHRHLLNDLAALLPHARKESKLDTKTKLFQLNELAELYNCNNVVYFEARKGKDLYVWISKPPNGPTIKFHVQNCMFRLASEIDLNLTFASSTYHGRAPLHRELPQRLSPHSVL